MRGFDTEGLKQAALEMAQKGVSTSTYGLSRNFNEGLCSPWPIVGNAYYGEMASAP